MRLRLPRREFRRPIVHFAGLSALLYAVMICVLLVAPTDAHRNSVYVALAALTAVIVFSAMVVAFAIYCAERTLTWLEAVLAQPDELELRRRRRLR